MCEREARVSLESGTVGGDRLVHSTLFSQRVAEAIVRARIARTNLDGATVGGDRVVDITLRAEKAPERILGVSILGVGPDRGSVRTHRVLHLAFTFEEVCEARKSAGTLRIELRRPAKCRDGLVNLLGFAQAKA